MGVTLQDLADRLSLARSTVSRALRGDAQVSPATRDRVAALAADLGYYPNEAARALTRRRADAIGLLLPRPSRLLFGNPYFSALIDGVASIAEPLGLALVLWTDAHGDPTAWLRGGRVDALIVLGNALDAAQTARLQALHDEGYAVIAIHPTATPSTVPYVTHDERDGLAAAIAAAFARGHRRAALITGDPHQTYAAARRERTRELAAGRLRIAAEDVRAGDDTHASGEAAARTLASAGRLGHGAATLILAGNDLMALGAREALHDLGLLVPDDLSLIGFDDIPAARWTNLASISPGTRALGAAAMAYLRDHVAGANPAPPAPHPTTFIARRSLGDAP
jgi:DNA-binding LacI/PurR family transcriptional regulator